ncbi:MAG: hypothetical protein HY042_09240 [Spirochaetia bacterium]|nr:hypothetical protein [Spirochaetia bacterium]
MKKVLIFVALVCSISASACFENSSDLIKGLAVQLSLHPPAADPWTVGGSFGGSITAITYANGKFYAVGSGGKVASSSDGISWTALNSNTTQGLNALIYAGGNFVAVGLNGTVVTSPDGTTWTAQTVGGATGTLHAVAYDGSSVYALVGSGGGGAYVCATTNLTVFTCGSVGGPTYQSLEAVVYSNGKFDAMGQQGGVYECTANCTTLSNWSVSVLLSNLNIYSVAFGAGQYVLVGSSNVSYLGYLATSANLTSFVQRSSNNSFQGVLYDGTSFVAVGNRGIVNHSTDGVNWAYSQVYGIMFTNPNVSSSTQPTLSSIAFDGKQYVAGDFNGRFYIHPKY